jgi:hypothetical protein
LSPGHASAPHAAAVVSPQRKGTEALETVEDPARQTDRHIDSNRDIQIQRKWEKVEEREREERWA